VNKTVTMVTEESGVNTEEEVQNWGDTNGGGFIISTED